MIQPLNLATIANKVVIIGFFDVIHKGHFSLFEYAKKNATPTILTFSSIPRKQSINNLETRVSNLKDAGIDDIIVFDINKNNMTAKEFVDKYLIHAKSIIVGSDFIFGSDFKSIWDFKDQINLHMIKYDERYSTTIIKKALLDGDIELANSLLVKDFAISSTVVEGNKLGRQIGFATANFNFDNDLKLKHGVYLTKTLIENKWYKSLTIYGKPNTIKITNNPIMETHILNFDNDLYGDKIKVQFHKRISDLKKYESKEKLIDAINEFVKVASTTKY